MKLVTKILIVIEIIGISVLAYFTVHSFSPVKQPVQVQAVTPQTPTPVNTVKEPVKTTKTAPVTQTTTLRDPRSVNITPPKTTAPTWNYIAPKDVTIPEVKPFTTPKYPDLNQCSDSNTYLCR